MSAPTTCPASPAPVSLRPGTPEDLDAVASLLTEVFAPDPLMRTIAAAAPDPATALAHLNRVELTTHYLAPQPATPVAVDLAVRTGSDGREEVLGVALWDAPATAGQEDPVGPLGPAGTLPEGLDLEVLGDAWELCLRDGALCDAVRPLEPHWYLYMVAVSPAARGQGVGSLLLGRGTARADDDGVAAHLEATTPASRRLYERHGFALAAQLGPCDPLPAYWALTRPAPGR